MIELPDLPDNLEELDCSSNELIRLPFGISSVKKIKYRDNPVCRIIHKYSLIELYDMNENNNVGIRRN